MSFGTLGMLGKWNAANLPAGSQLIRTEIVTEGDGTRVQVDSYANPFRGSFQLRTPIAGAERHPILIPVTTIQGDATRIRPQGTAMNGGGEPRKDSTADRRSIPRPDRDVRSPNPDKPADAGAGERRTGKPWFSFLTELKSFFLKPAGAVVLGIAFFALVMAVRRKKAAA